VDILYVAAGTTAGLRQADAAMLAALAACGVSTGAVTPSFAAPAPLRSRIYGSTLGIDVYESLALRWATQKALRRYAPRAVMYAVTHAALLAPRAAAGRPTAIRFDTPVQLSRWGRRFVPEHRLEQRRFRAATVLLPWGLEVAPEIALVLPASTGVVAVPVPVQPVGSTAHRDSIAVTYAGSPGKKGLDLVVGAWNEAAVGDRVLVITGIPKPEGLRFLAQRGVAEPRRAEWPGLISHAEFRALTCRADLYLSASTYENYGIAQLEALLDGALLVTVASEGPFAALPLARELAPELVSTEPTAEGLARALACALDLSDAAQKRYRERAVDLVHGHTGAAVEERLRSEVLPRLLSGRV
jgi:hypothetical protein